MLESEMSDNVVFRRRDEPPVFTPEQERAIDALADSPTITEAALKAEVSRSSVHRWLQDRWFAQRVREARHEALRHGVGILHYSLQRAAITLLEIMEDPHAPPACRVSAARALIAHSYTGYDLDRVEEKIAEIDAARKEIESRYG